MKQRVSIRGSRGTRVHCVALLTNVGTATHERQRHVTNVLTSYEMIEITRRQTSSFHWQRRRCRGSCTNMYHGVRRRCLSMCVDEFCSCTTAGLPAVFL